ncbi:thioesterase-like superfamily-domain-containing protein [Mycena filopes]|nr:thioesterase-like superfamily-domain-containing protein [Mycena filopes]
MAPLTKAMCVARQASHSPDGSPLFSAYVDPQWVVGQVPQGGYILSLLVQACIESQADSAHPDPLQISAFFLQATRPSTTVSIQLRVLKRGRTFVNMAADLIFGNRVCITAHLIFGRIPIPARTLIDPASGYGRRHPLVVHPSEAVVGTLPDVCGYSDQVRWAPEPRLAALNVPARTGPGGGVAHWGAWVELTDKQERITPASLLFFADCIDGFPRQFPQSVTGATRNQLWLPTLSLGLEFKNPIPPPGPRHASRTVAVYCISGFPSEPQMRHSTFVEIWSAPSNIGEGEPGGGWEDDQVCLAIATQTQLISNAGENEKVAAKL